MPSNSQIALTEEEKQKLESELDVLVSVKRPEIAKKIGRAAADGDLSENSAYHDAKEQQGHVEGRIMELKYLVRNAVVVEPQTDQVSMGTTVHIKDEMGKKRSYRLVSRHGARPSEGLISDESPLGRAMLGHTPGESVTYKTPSGDERSVKILRIE